MIDFTRAASGYKQAICLLNRSLAEINIRMYVRVNNSSVVSPVKSALVIKPTVTYRLNRNKSILRSIIFTRNFKIRSTAMNY